MKLSCVGSLTAWVGLANHGTPGALLCGLASWCIPPDDLTPYVLLHPGSLLMNFLFGLGWALLSKSWHEHYYLQMLQGIKRHAGKSFQSMAPHSHWASPSKDVTHRLCVFVVRTLSQLDPYRVWLSFIARELCYSLLEGIERDSWGLWSWDCKEQCNLQGDQV